MIPVYIVDSFTDVPFRGNPAAVCILPSVIPDNLMQAIAFEMNCPETAFVLKHNDGFMLRWFSPLQEVDLCGHATLATAHVLYSQQVVNTHNEIKFNTKSGSLTVVYRDDIIIMNFPKEEATECSIQQWIIDALGASPLYVGKIRLDYLIEVKSEKEVNVFTAYQVSQRGGVLKIESTDNRVFIGGSTVTFLKVNCIFRRKKYANNYCE